MSRWLAPFFALLALANLSACVTQQAVEPPEITLQNVRLLEMQGFTQYLEVELLVANPNKYAIPLTGLKFDMQMNGLDFAQGLSNEQVDIPGLGRAVVPVKVSVSALAVMKQINAARNRTQLDYQVKGTAYLDHLLLPSISFDQAGALQLQSGADRGFKVM